MNPLRSLLDTLPRIEEKIGYVFKNKELLISAFVHRSFLNEHKGEIKSHNERLEFLGDSVLGLAMADFLYHRFPTHPEGPLSQLRSRLVDANACAHFLKKLHLSEYILLGRGERLGDGNTKISILADAFEALLGAIFLDGGFISAKSFLLSHFGEEVENLTESPSRNYKAELQDYSQKKFQKTPTYKVLEEKGPDHAKIFSVAVLIDNQEAGIGLGESKKQAEQQAAFDALSKLGINSL